MKDLFATNWEAELTPADMATRHEGGEEMQVVLLAGLQRLARNAGLIRQDVEIKTPSDTMVQAIFRATFSVAPYCTNEDTIYGSTEVQFVGTADCSAKNTSGKFLNYPTAVAESRAEARALRKALGIKILSSEEVGLRENFGTLEASASNKADGQLIAAIEKLCENRSIDPVRVLDEVIEDPTRSNTIFQLAELTTAEAQRAMSWLNEQKPSKKVASAEEERTKRKEELKAKAKS